MTTQLEDQMRLSDCLEHSPTFQRIARLALGSSDRKAREIAEAITADIRAARKAKREARVREVMALAYCLRECKPVS